MAATTQYAIPSAINPSTVVDTTSSTSGVTTVTGTNNKSIVAVDGIHIPRTSKDNHNYNRQTKDQDANVNMSNSKPSK